MLKSWLWLAQWFVLDSNEMKYEHVITVRDAYTVEINIIGSLNISDISISLGEWPSKF